MNIRRSFKLSSGYTLLEVTLVIGLLLALMAGGLGGMGWFSKMADSKRAEAILKQVQNARISWLIDNPTKSVEDVTLAGISDYLPFPDVDRELSALGYALADVTSVPICYQIVTQGALPIPGYSLAPGGAP